MERFVQSIVAGGISLVAGLWLLTLLDAWTTGWLLGVGLALVGTAGLAGGIWTEIDY